MRILGIDFGGRRIGLALSDPTGTIASPLTTLTRRPGKRPPWPELELLIREHEVERIVVGLPLDLAGDEGSWAAEVRAFADKAGAKTGLPVEMVDERMTSVRAERLVRGSGLPKHKREEKSRVDSTAAALILQAYLDLRQSH